MPNDFHLETACYELFGSGWEYEVAKRLGVTSRSVKRWATGQNLMPDEIEAFVRFWQRGQQ